MSHICYSDEKSANAFNVPYDKQNANKIYLSHFSNYLYLNFILQNSDRKIERDQARKELDICERKLKYWKRHANFDQQVVANECAKLKADWAKR